MACKYYVDGKELNETQFKELLNDGLLDQILVNQGLQEQFSDFEIDENFISKKLGKTVGPLKLRVRHKIDHQINFEKALPKADKGELMGSTEFINTNRNPLKVIEKSNEQIKKENKKNGTNYPANKLILAVNVGGVLRYGDKMGKDHEAVKSIERNKAILERMKPGKVYMLVPSAYGFSPIETKSNFLGETEIADDVKENIKNLFESKKTASFKAAAQKISDNLFNTTITKKGEEVTIKTFLANKEEITKTFGTAEEMTKFVLGEYDNGKLKKGSTQTGLLAHVNHYRLNKKGPRSNSYYANNKFITTNLFSENGNFFNSTSFIMDAYKSTEQTKKVLVDVIQARYSKQEKEIEEKVIEKTAIAATTTVAKDQKKKTAESPINDNTIKEVKDSQEFIIQVPATSGNIEFAKVFVKAVDNTLEMYEVQKGSMKKGPKGDLVWTPDSKQFTNTQKGTIRKAALPKFLELKKKFNVKDITVDQQNNEPNRDAGTGLFDGAAKQTSEVEVSEKEMLNAELEYLEKTFGKEMAGVYFQGIEPLPKKNQKDLNRILSNLKPAQQTSEVTSDREFQPKLYIKAYDELRNSSKEELQKVLDRIRSAAMSNARQTPISTARSFIASKILKGKTKELDAKYAKPTQPIAEVTEVEDKSEEGFNFNAYEGVKGGEKLDLKKDNFPDIDIPRTRSTQIDGRLWNKTQELQWLKDKLGKSVVDKNFKSFNSIEDLEKYLPKETYEMLIESRKNGEFLSGLFNKAAVYLANNAFADTGYHEAFHVVFNLGLTLEQRLDLLEEAALRYNMPADSTLIEIEERLADEFMAYVRAEEKIKTPSSKIANFFKSLWRGVKTFFNKNSKINIDNLFESIQLGEYANKLSFENTDFTKINPDDVRLKTDALATSYFNPKIKREAFDYMAYKLFQEIDKIKDNDIDLADKSDSEVIKYLANETPVGFNRIFGTITQRIIADINANKGKDVSNLAELVNAITNRGKATEDVEIDTKNGKELLPLFKEEFTPIVLEFNRYLRKSGINISLVKNVKDNLERPTDFENNEIGTSERWQKANIEINPFETLSQTMRRQLGTLPKQIIVNNKRKQASNSFGAPVYYSQAEVFAFLGENLTDSYMPARMIEKIESIKKDKPFMPEVINLLGKNTAFKNSLFIQLASKTFQKFLVVYEKDGNYSTFYSNRKTLDNLIKETFITNFLQENNKLFNKYKKNTNKEGQRNFESFNNEEINKQVLILDAIKIAAKGAATIESKNNILKSLETFLKENNLNISENQLLEIWNPDGDVNNWNKIKKVIDSTESIFSSLLNEKNPFLELVSDEKSGFKVVLKSFVESVKPGFDNTVNASFISGDKKAVYSIQYSNYLTKLISKFKNKKDFVDYKEYIKSDVLMSSVPLLEDLMEDEETTSNMKELEVVILDSLVREGKRRGTNYSDLNDTEKVAVELGAYFGGKTSKNFEFGQKFGYYSLPIPSDSGTLPLIKAEKFTFDEVVERFLTIAVGERARIEKFKNLPEDSILRKIKNYKDNATKFQSLSFLEGKVTANTEVSEIKDIIEKFLKEDFLELQKEKYKEAGVIEYYEKGNEGKIKFIDNVITNRADSKSELFKNYLYNSYLMNTQMNILFSKDPAFYKNTVEYQKRNKQVLSPGTLGNPDRILSTYRGMIFNDELVPTSIETKDNILKLLDQSNLSAQKKSELKTFWEDSANPSEEFKDSHHNITDGATFVSVDRAYDALDYLKRITPEHKKARERIKKGIENAEDAALFNVTKPFVFTDMKIEGTIAPLQIKNSEVLLTKAFAYRKNSEGKLMYPKLVKAYDLLNNSEYDIDFIAFESAVKEGAIGREVNNKGEVVYNELELVGDKYELVGDANVIEIDSDSYRLQNETPEHYLDAEGNYGSQYRNLLIEDMDMEGDYNIGGKILKGKEVQKLYQELTVDNVTASYNKVAEMFLDESGEIDYSSLVVHLQEEAIRRDLGEQYIEALELVDEVKDGKKTGKKVPAIPLWSPVISYKLENLMNSFFKNGVTKQKIKGGQMINATSYGVDKTLEFKIDENGNYRMEALLPWWSKKFFPKDSKGNIDLNKLPKELKEFVGYRIPTEDKYSMFYIEVIGFTDSAAGAQIMLPDFATTQAGLDFDIDKLFMIMPEYRVNSKKEAVYLKYLDSNSTAEEVASTILKDKESFDTFINSNSLPKTITDSLGKKIETKQYLKNFKNRVQDSIIKSLNNNKQFKNRPEFKEAFSRVEELKIKRDAETNESKEKAYSKQITDLYEVINEIDTSIYSEIAAEKETLLRNKIEEFIEKNIKPNQYKDFNNIATRNNKILEISKGILENKHTALSIIDVGGFEDFKTLGNKIRLLQINKNDSKQKLNLKEEALKNIKNLETNKINISEYRNNLKNLVEELDTVDFNINYPSTQLTLFNRNMMGKKLTGVFANQTTNHAKSQYTELQLVSPVLFNDKKYKMLNQQNNSEGNRISKSLASLLAAVVDNAKDPISSNLNLNTFTADLASMLLRAGVNQDTVFSFINQPAIVELTKKHFLTKGALSYKAKEEAFKVVKKWKSLLADKGKITTEELNAIEEDYNLNEKDLEKALSRDQSKEYYVTQYKALSAFNTYLETAKDLSDIVQASRLDTQPVGPTSADSYVMINKQQKLLNSQSLGVKGYEALFFNQSDQKINPSFNEYAWLKPLSIFNKIFPSIGETLSTSKEIKYSLLGNTKNYFSDFKGKGFDLTATEARNIDNSFMTYIATKLPFFNNANSKEILKNVPNNLAKFKIENPDSIYNDFLKYLDPKEATKTSIRKIDYNNVGKSPLDQEVERELWKDMLVDKDPSVRRLALDLVKYSYFSNGFTFNSTSFYQLIPVQFFTDTFARLDINKEEGLIDDSNNSFHANMQNSLKEFTKRPNIVGKGNLLSTTGAPYHFMRQFAQNNINSGTIPSVNIKESRAFTPNNVKELAIDEVYVFGTTQEGYHNVGTAGLAFNNNTTFTNKPGNKNQKGRWAEYGVVGKTSQGNEGVGFGLRMQEVVLENNLVKDILGPNNLQDGKKLIDSFQKDFGKLVIEAYNNPKRKFIVGKLDTDTKRWSTKDIQKVLKNIEINVGIPNNVILPALLDPRINKSRFIKENKLFVVKKESTDLTDSLGNFPQFVSTLDGATKKLFELNQDKYANDILVYNQIPLLEGQEYNYDSPIDESVVTSINKEETSTVDNLVNKEMFSDNFPDVDIPLIGDNATPTNTKEKSNFSTEVKKEYKDENQTYSEYIKLYTDKNKTEDPAITKNKWRFLLPETRQDQIDRLKKC